METFINSWEFVFLIYFLIINGGYGLLNILSFFSINKHLKYNLHEAWLTKFNNYDTPISIIAPAYNEELTIVESVRSMLNLNYSEYEVIVVCDGPKDKTLEKLIEAYTLVPTLEPTRLELKHKPIKNIYISLVDKRLKVVLKENGGKADALNCGINISNYPLFCAIDADSILDSEALHKLAQPFLFENNTVATGGIIRIANGCEIIDGVVKKVDTPNSWLETIQIVEYLRAYFLGRMGWIPLDSIMIISGAFGLFSKKAVIGVNGYNQNTVGEDMELVLKLRSQSIQNNTKINISFIPDAVCWTQCPNDIKTLSNQRKRWQRGLLESLWGFKNLFLNRKGGFLSFFAFPFFVFIEALGPIFELIGYLSFFSFAVFGIIDWKFCFYFYLLAVCLGLTLSISAIFIEEIFFDYYRPKHILKLFLACLLENLWFRYAHFIWRLLGIIQYLRGKSHWGEMKRINFNMF